MEIRCGTLVKGFKQPFPSKTNWENTMILVADAAPRIDSFCTKNLKCSEILNIAIMYGVEAIN